MCRDVHALLYQRGISNKKGLGMPNPVTCVHASPCACPLTAPMRMPLKGQEGWSKMTQTSGSSRPHRGAFSTGVTDSNEQKPTVTDSGFWRPGAEELDGDARVRIGGRGVPGAA
jgi:hypothetical protein